MGDASRAPRKAFPPAFMGWAAAPLTVALMRSSSLRVLMRPRWTKIAVVSGAAGPGGLSPPQAPLNPNTPIQPRMRMAAGLLCENAARVCPPAGVSQVNSRENA
jgi:hypothetical protein